MEELTVQYTRLPGIIVVYRKHMEAEINDKYVMVTWQYPERNREIGRKYHGVQLAQAGDIYYGRAYYFLDRWYAITETYNKDWELTGFYCDITTPAVFCGNRLCVTDLKLDLWVRPDRHTYYVLDEDEFLEAVRKKWLPPALVAAARRSLRTLIQMVKEDHFPPIGAWEPEQQHLNNDTNQQPQSRAEKSAL